MNKKEIKEKYFNKFLDDLYNYYFTDAVTNYAHDFIMNNDDEKIKDLLTAFNIDFDDNDFKAWDFLDDLQDVLFNHNITFDEMEAEQ